MSQLIEHERIETTVAKVRRWCPFALVESEGRILLALNIAASVQKSGLTIFQSAETELLVIV